MIKISSLSSCLYFRRVFQWWTVWARDGPSQLQIPLANGLWRNWEMSDACILTIFAPLYFRSSQQRKKLLHSYFGARNHLELNDRRAFEPPPGRPTCPAALTQGRLRNDRLVSNFDRADPCFDWHLSEFGGKGRRDCRDCIIQKAPGKPCELNLNLNSVYTELSVRGMPGVTFQRCPSSLNKSVNTWIGWKEWAAH